MGREDWYYVHFPKLLIKRLDEFLQTPRAKGMGMSNKPELLRHVINRFLDEQEAFYNKTETVGDLILKTKDRDHLVLTFNDEPQLEEIVNAFIKRGINYNLNVLGTLAGQLIEQGRYDDAVKKDNEISEAIKGLKTSTTIFCLYKSIPEDLEDRLSEYHDLVIKRSFKSTSTSSLH